MKQSILVKCLLAGVIGSAGALAEMTVEMSNGVLTITSDKSGTLTAKVIGPNDEVIVNEKYEGSSSFTWVASGEDGAYRYDVRVDGDYAGGSIEIVNNSIVENIEKTEVEG